MEERIDREKSFHDGRFGADSDSRETLSRLQDDLLKLAKRATYDAIQARCSGKTVLDYGCGLGSVSCRCVRDYGARSVVGIDVSDVAVDCARRLATERRIDNITFEAMNAEAMTLADDTFDLACGFGILHHLDLSRSISELARVLKPDGTAVFLEPLGHNPALNLFRRMTPGLRTADEHPLLLKDLDVVRAHFGRLDVRFFNLTTLAVAPWPRYLGRRYLLHSLAACDRVLFARAPFLRKFAWEILLTFSEPR
ncbi:MAG: class I SAM-dependent methyltransferase [Pirellulales bacterium]|nr:class I SAM-dependent methyltransferase [Pirellulales bacterium]